MKNPDKVFPGCIRSRRRQRGYQDWWRIVLLPSGNTHFSGIYEDEIEKHRSSAIADITFNRRRVPESYSLMPYLVERIPKEHRNCFMYCHFLKNDFNVRWCEQVKKESTRKGTFDEGRGRKCCSFFGCYRAPQELPKVDLVENVDYTIWINPNLGPGLF